MKPYSERLPDPRRCAPDSLLEPIDDDATRRQRCKVYLNPKPIDLRKSFNGLAAIVKVDIKVTVFDQVLSFASTSNAPREDLVSGAQRRPPLAQRLEAERIPGQAVEALGNRKAHPQVLRRQSTALSFRSPNEEKNA